MTKSMSVSALSTLSALSAEATSIALWPRSSSIAAVPAATIGSSSTTSTRQARGPSMRAGPARIDGPRACRVLVVDDDPIVAAGTAAMLEDLGHRAIEAASAEIALQVLSSEPGIDFVIT